MSFASPFFLLALIVVALAAAAYVWLQRRPPRYAVDFTNMEVLATVAAGERAWRRHVPAALLLLALTSLAVGLARPQADVMVARENATVVLTIDSSGSMFAEDVKPTRLAAAQVAVRTFVKGVPKKFRLGLVTFAAEPQLVAPVSRDHSLVISGLEFLYPLRGTAIGDAVARSAEIAREAVGGTGGRPLVASIATPYAAASGSNTPAAVVFLSDGFQTHGYLTPEAGAERARRLGIPVYTIALGTPDGFVEFGWRRIPVPPDRQSLRMIAERTGGEYFDAPTAKALEAAYKDLGSRLAREPGKMEATFALLAAGAFFLLAAVGFSLLSTPRLP